MSLSTPTCPDSQIGSPPEASRGGRPSSSWSPSCSSWWRSSCGWSWSRPPTTVARSWPWPGSAASGGGARRRTCSRSCCPSPSSAWPSGILAAPFAMALVARVVFPVPVPLEVRGGFLLAAVGGAVAVVAVVLVAAARAVREPVDSLLRAVRARHTGTGANAVETALVAFSLAAVVALLSGNLEGPLATLAPTLLAVAVGLLLGRALAPVTRVVSRRLLRRGRAVAAAGIVTAVRRPAARRVLVMVVVASALLVFCVDAMVTGQHNRQNAAEQANGAPYSLDVAGHQPHRPDGRGRGGGPRTRARHPCGHHDPGRFGHRGNPRRGLRGLPAGGLLPAVVGEPRRLGRDRRAAGRAAPADRTDHGGDDRLDGRRHRWSVQRPRGPAHDRPPAARGRR